MRVLQVSWEYPPLTFGGLGRHVVALAETQAARGDEVVVITRAGEGAPADEIVNGVRVLRVERDAPFVPFESETLLAWISGLNSAISRRAVALLREWQPEVVHGHDWLVAQASVLIADLAPAPYVTTMHATEAGRHQGWLPADLSRGIHSIEWWSTGEAARVIACSQHMRWEVSKLFDLPAEEIAVIPNGINAGEWTITEAARSAMRDRHPAPTVLFTGRLEWEKGVHTLIEAIPELRKRVPGVHIVIAGRGSADAKLKEQVKAAKLGKAVTFYGWLPEDELHALVSVADVAVVPSLYEPFGIVALEAAAVGTPLAVARTGGLAEIVIDGQTGWTFEPGSASELADAVASALLDPTESRRRADVSVARIAVEFTWESIAERTDRVYREAIASPFGGRGRRAEEFAPPPGNLLTGALS